MTDILKKHRVIGIRHTLKEIKNAGLISPEITYPSDAVDELKKTHNKANSAKRHRCARSDASIYGITKEIERLFNLPDGSVQLIYPTGRKVRIDSTVGALRRHWDNYEYEE